MRLLPASVALLATALAWSAAAQTGIETAQTHFEAELSDQCPDKQLEWLSPADLRDGLDDFLGDKPDLRAQTDQAERSQCSSEDSGAACVNPADVAAIDRAGRIDELGRWICATFLRCRDRGVCDYER